MKLRKNWKNTRKQLKYIAKKHNNRVKRLRKKKTRTIRLNSDGYLSLDGGNIERSEHSINTDVWHTKYSKQPYDIIMPYTGIMTGTQVDTDTYNEYLKDAQNDISDKLGLHPNQVIIDDPAVKEMVKKKADKNWKEFHKQYTIPTYAHQSLITRRIAQGTGISQNRLEGTERGVIVGSEIEGENPFYTSLPEIRNADLHNGAWTIRNVAIQKRTNRKGIGMWEEDIFSKSCEDVRATIKFFTDAGPGNGRAA